MNNNVLYLLTVLEAIEKILIYTKGKVDADELYYCDDQKDFNAVMNLLIAIGENVGDIDNELKAVQPDIDWPAIVGLRNELAHNYRGVDPDLIWDIVQNHLIILKHTCINILASINPDRQMINNIVSTEFYKHLNYLRDLFKP